MRHIGVFALAVAGWLSIPAARAGEPPLLAVFEMEDCGTGLPKQAVVNLTTYLEARLVEGGYRVIPQSQIKERLADQKQGSYKVCYDQSCQIEMGRELAAQKVLSTQILKIGTGCQLASKLFDLKQVAAEMAATAGGPCEENELLKSVQEIAGKLIQRLQGGETPHGGGKTPPPPPPIKDMALKDNIPAPPPEGGEPPSPSDTVHAHDGWFLRLAAGGGFAWSGVKSDVRIENATMGGGLSWSGSAGYTIAPNVAVHLDSFGITLFEPNAYRDEVKEPLKGTYSLAAVGAGMTYYFMPSNLFVSAVAGLGVLRAKFADVATLETEAGFAANVLFGKEWWISDDWAIGVTAQAMYSAVPSRWETTQNTIAASVLFCATFN